MRTISNDECITRHKFKVKKFIYNTTLCTYIDYDAGSYYGDSGGPLIINNKLVGVLSWGIIRDEEKQPLRPEQFTRISEYTQWIEEKTGNNVD